MKTNEEQFESLVRQFRYAASAPCVFTNQEFQGLSNELVKIVKKMTAFSIRQTHQSEKIMEPDPDMIACTGCFGGCDCVEVKY